MTTCRYRGHRYSHCDCPWWRRWFYRVRRTTAMTEPDYIVIRPAAGVPVGFLPKDWDGLWLDRNQIGTAIPNLAFDLDRTAIAGATGRFEARADGAVAEVFEVRLFDGQAAPDA